MPRLAATLLVLLATASAQMFGRGGQRDPLAGMSQEERDHMQGTPGAQAVDSACRSGTTSPTTRR